MDKPKLRLVYDRDAQVLKKLAEAAKNRRMHKAKSRPSLVPDPEREEGQPPKRDNEA